MQQVQPHVGEVVALYVFVARRSRSWKNYTYLHVLSSQSRPEKLRITSPDTGDKRSAESGDNDERSGSDIRLRNARGFRRRHVRLGQETAIEVLEEAKMDDGNYKSLSRLSYHLHRTSSDERTGHTYIEDKIQRSRWEL